VLAVATFLTAEPAEEAVEGLTGVSESLVERHEEAALLATIILGAFGGLSLGALLWFRRRALPRAVTLLLLAVALVPTGAMAWTANLGGQIRHTEVRPGATAAGPVEAGRAEGKRAEHDD
jgi:hypothetical protein